MAETLPRWNLNSVDFVEVDTTAILTDLIKKYEDLTERTLAKGDPVRLFLLTIAERISELENSINIAAQQNLLSYAQNNNLNALGSNLGVDRLGESYAITTLRFKLVQALGEAYVIPANFEATNGDVIFSTSEELVIPAGELTGDVSAYCTTAGTAGNGYVAGQINTIVKPMTFLESVENITITSGGADMENDPEYANRIKLAPNSYSVAGPEKAYIYHADSVSSAIIDVKPCTIKGTGEVKLYLLLEGGELPTEDVIASVQDYFLQGDKSPMTDDVQVLAPKAKEYTINVDYWINESDKATGEAIRAAVDEAVEKYRLWQQTKIGRDITPDELIGNVKKAGAARVDFSTLSPASWIKLEDSEVAQCVGLSVNFIGYKEE